MVDTLDTDSLLSKYARNQEATDEVFSTQIRYFPNSMSVSKNLAKPDEALERVEEGTEERLEGVGDGL
jgi:hypothetical protein